MQVSSFILRIKVDITIEWVNNVRRLWTIVRRRWIIVPRRRTIVPRQGFGYVPRSFCLCFVEERLILQGVENFPPRDSQPDNSSFASLTLLAPLRSASVAIARHSRCKHYLDFAYSQLSPFLPISSRNIGWGDAERACFALCSWVLPNMQTSGQIV